jgi:protein-disulfide isomerase
MHDLLFANQQHAQRDDLVGYATRLGLDIERFRRDMDSDRIKATIESDKADGRQLHVNGTPTFYVNGREYSGNTPLAELRRIVVAEQRRARALDDVDDASMSRGPVNAPVTLEMFVDLRSPVSRPAVDAVNELMGRYPSQVRLQFRHFPLAFHPYAALAHEAAVAAARSGRFWEFATSLLNQPGSLREPELVALAGRIGLDETVVARALHDHLYAPRVDADLQAGLKKGIRGSPAILVNGRRIDGVPTVQTLTECVEAALSARRQTAELRKQ